MGKTNKSERMNYVKHTHGEMLFTDAVDYMQWVETLSDGRLFTVMGVGKPDGARNNTIVSQFLFGRISEDGGKTWGAPYFLFAWPNRKTAYCLQGWKSDREGRIHVFAAAITKYDVADMSRADLQGHIAYVRFDSFRGENPLYSEIPALSRYTGSLNNAIELESGRLVVPFSTYLGGKFVSNTIWSDDHGDNWYASNDVNLIDDETNCESGAVEPVVAEVESGTLVMIIRTVKNYFYYAISRDSGESWSVAMPTRIPSSNAPATLQKLPDGRIFIAWNDCLGHPMHSVHYSAARQCLHGALSDDGLRTLHGVRILAKKVKEDKDSVMNCYPTTSMANDGEILLKHIEVDGKDGSNWRAVAGYLVRLDPSFLMEPRVQDNWIEWVTSQPVSEDGIHFSETEENAAHAIGNFPYAEEGSLILKTTGEKANVKIMLADCYLDRSTFFQNSRTARYADFVGKPYIELHPARAGAWQIIWDKTMIRLYVDGALCEEIPKTIPGFNHVGILVDAGELHLTHFSSKAEKAYLQTGISY